MEQTEVSHASRVLQCGRRMFLAALILASKWLQDRNYSARAWSKISGLKISEINENEIAFLAAVNWKLHLGEELYRVWSDCVMEHTPSTPPSPGAGARCFERECAVFKKLIRGLTPELDNIKDLVLAMDTQSPPSASKVARFVHPSFMEPQPATVCSPSRQLPTLPALGLLPSPRSTPRPVVPQLNCGFSTPAVGAASRFLGRTHPLSSAMSHANAISASQTLDRWSISTPAPATAFTTCRTSSPQNYVPTRRSSLATTVSTASSPESMVSDSSSQSRNSSISSASLSHHAPAYMQARRAVGERQRMVYGQHYPLGQSSFDDALASKRTVAVADMVDIPEYSSLDEADAPIRSPDSYSAYPADLALEKSSVDQPYQLSVRDAAFALQELHNHRDADESAAKTPRTWSVPARQGPKRKRADDSALQENVRGLLAAQPDERGATWSDAVVGVSVAQPALSSPTKRVRISATSMYQPHLRGPYGQLIPAM